MKVKEMSDQGKLIWITGLSGAGKTTIAKNVYEELKKSSQNIVHLDGDELRIMLGDLAEYDNNHRKNIAGIYARICKHLVGSGINTIISTIALYHDIHEYNRMNNENYYEIFLQVDKNVLLKRNKKVKVVNPFIIHLFKFKLILKI